VRARELGLLCNWRFHREHVVLVAGGQERVRLRLGAAHSLAVQVGVGAGMLGTTDKTAANV